MTPNLLRKALIRGPRGYTNRGFTPAPGELDAALAGLSDALRDAKKDRTVTLWRWQAEIIYTHLTGKLAP